MWPMLGGMFSGGASLLGSIFSSNQSAENTQQQIAASQQQQATQNAFSERMSSTAYQRASTDMQAAGLNPAMMFGSGSAASSPSGSSIQAPMPQTKSPMEGLGDAASKVVSSAVSVKTFEKMTEEIARIQADTALTKAQEATEKERPLNVAVGTARQQSELPVSRLRGKEAEAVLSMPAWLRNTLTQAGWSADKGGKVADLISELVPSAKAAKRLFGNSPSRRSTVERSDASGRSSFEERFHYD
ncbi:MAG: DNA pilot protein [Microvirus sp.]|nr:MAG: DNA pilot protein [Microvirus sp.]